MRQNSYLTKEVVPARIRCLWLAKRHHPGGETGLKSLFQKTDRKLAIRLIIHINRRQNVRSHAILIPWCIRNGGVRRFIPINLEITTSQSKGSGPQIRPKTRSTEQLRDMLKTHLTKGFEWSMKATVHTLYMRRLALFKNRTRMSMPTPSKIWLHPSQLRCRATATCPWLTLVHPVQLKFIEIKDAKETVILTKSAQTSCLDTKSPIIIIKSSRVASPGN